MAYFAPIKAKDVWEYIARTLTSAENITSDGNPIDQSKIANLDVAVSTRSSHSPADVWSYSSRTLTSAENITSDGNPIDQSKIAKLTNLDVAVSTRSSHSPEDVVNLFGQKTGNNAYIWDDFEGNDLLIRPVFWGFYNNELRNLRRPWTVISGSASLSDGIMTISKRSIVSTPSAFVTGTWEVFFNPGAPDSYSQNFEFIYQDDSNYYVVVNSIGGNAIQLRKVQGGQTTNLIEKSGCLDDAADHTIKVTRTSSGTWELFLDGASIGTATDPWLPSPQSIRFNNKSYVTIKIKSLKVY